MRTFIHKKRAFTLVELLVVITIIGILVGMLLPAVQRVREAANRTSCSNNLQNLAMASISYQSTHLKFPSASVWKNLDGDFDSSTGMGIMDTTRQNGESFETFSGFVLLLPNLDQKNIYDRFIGAQGAFNPNDANSIDAGVLSTVSLAPLKCASAAGNENIGFEIEGIELQTSHFMMVNGVTGADVNPTSTDNAFAMPDSIFDSSENGAIGLSGAYGGSLNATSVNNLFTPATGKKMSEFSDGTSNSFAFGENSKADKGDYVGRRSGWAIGFVVSGEPLAIDNSNITRSVAAVGVLPNGRTIHVGNANVMPSEVNLAGPLAGNTELFNNTSFASNHTGGSQFAMVDGSARFVSESVDTQILAQVATINGAEIIDADAL